MSATVTLMPEDEYNSALVSNVHPADWQNPTPAKSYNLVVIGAGTAGLVTAAAAAGLGAKVALVEKHLMGGDCLNVGCVPSKALIRASRAASELGEAPGFGITWSGGQNVDFAKVMERLRRLRADISLHDSVERFSGLGIDVFLGQGRFKGHNLIEVEGKELKFKKAVVATGARPATPPIPGLEKSGYLTNETVFSLTQLPQRLLVIGGGPIGCELAQAFQRLGSEVTLVEAKPLFLPREDPDAAEILKKQMLLDGIDLRLNTRVVGVSREDGARTALVSNGDSEERLNIDQILVGTGRIPNVEELNLEVAGIKFDRRDGVTVNDRLQTTNRNVYAAGDVALSHKFTHMADAAARLVVQNSLFLGRKKASSLTIPWCTYTTPEIAHVGLSEKTAKHQKIKLSTFKIGLEQVDRAILDGERDGFVKIHVKKGSDQIVGATIVARHAGDMISEITLAMENRIGLGSIAAVIHPYPTQAEAIRKAADAYNRTRLTPFLKRLFEKWLRWRR